FDGDTHTSFTNNDGNSIRIVNQRIYGHHVLRMNYMTYDVRCDYNIINPRQHAFVMVKSPETDPDTHLYWYVQVLGIYHADV
ncbi:hypothetical protein ARMGADRAFT_947893, partial [Armillaria gallica]